MVKLTAVRFRIESNIACSRLKASQVIMITIFKNARDPEREKLSFFHATTPFSRSGKSYFALTLLFATSLLKPESMEQAKRNTKKLINNDKTS